MFCEIVSPAKKARLVVPEIFDQEPRDRVGEHQEAHHLAVPTPQGIIGRQQEQEDQAVEGRVELRRVDRQRVRSHPAEMSPALT